MPMPGIIPPGPDGVGGAADAGRVIAGEGDTRWAGLTHEELWAMVQQGDPVAASEAASFAWMKTQLLIQSIEERLAAVVSGTVADWEGAAATASLGAVSTLGQWAIEGAAGARNIGQTLLDQSHEALHVRQQMPPPRTEALSAEWDKFWKDPGYVVEHAFDGFADLRALEEQAANDAQRARELMAQYEARSRGEHIPRMQDMTPPPQVTAGIGPAAAPPGGPGVTAPGLGTPVPAGVAPVGLAGAPGVPPPPVGEVPPPPGPGAPGAPPAAVPPVPPSQAAPVPGRNPPGAAATPPATRPTPVPGQGTTGPGTPAGTPPGTSVTPPQRADRTTGPTPPGLPSTPSAPRPGGPGTGAAPPGGVRPVVPRAPAPAPLPGWRDVVQSNPGTGAAPHRPPAPVGRPVPEAPVRAAPLGERAGPGVAEPAARSPAPRYGGSHVPGMYPPLAAGMGAGGQDREHRRPPFLTDDTGAFADDRWFPPAVITPDT
jgi:hypothetical protein